MTVWNIVLFLISWFWIASMTCVSFTTNVLFSSKSRLLAPLSSVSANNENMPLLNVGIVGAGPSGLLLAHLLLQQENIKVTLFESRSDPRSKNAEQRAYALGIGIRGRTAIRQVDEDLWQTVKNRGFESERFQLHVGGLVIPLRSEKDASNKDGLIVEPSVLTYQTDLCGALLDELERRFQGSGRLKMHFQTTIKECNLDSMALSLENEGKDLIQPPLADKSYDIIVGADGVNSIVRNSIRQSHPSFQTSKESLPGEFKVVRVDKGPPKVDPASVSLILPRSGSTTAFVEPTGLDGSCCILFAGGGESAILSERMNKTAIVEELQTAFPQWKAISESMASQLICQLKTGASSVVCNTYHYNDKAVLIGDAAHATGGVSGQGVNSALQDCVVLAGCITSNRNNLENALLSYSKSQVLEGKALYDLSFGPKPEGIKAWIWAFLSVRDTLFRGRLGIGRPPLQTRLTTSLTPFSVIRRENDYFYSEVFPSNAEIQENVIALHEDAVQNKAKADSSLAC
ncbi:kynurenine 3-monooxygenase [Nitzschia inconspicua]|uniref:Kynurenine 3-monooxygenase n=1 Tax=Nitzschia inconspicua TaxID=303405 RepID=A0A9K3KP95_9STRA|nr:kynurenine 3-monooxygenase [Nitzschia inconspicua]